MRRTAAQQFAFAFAAAATALLAMFMSPAPAWAHAVVLSTTPTNWQVLAVTPAEVSVRFNEPVDLGLAGIRLIGPEGDEVKIGKPAHPDGKPDIVTVPVPDVLTDGTYTVAWHVVSADTHPVQGAFAFSVGQPTSTGAPEVLAGSAGNGTVRTLYDVLRWASFAGFALLVGSTYFVALCWPGGARQRAVRRLLWGGFWSLLAATAFGLLLYGPYAAGRSLAAIVDPRLIATTLGARMGLMLGLRLVLLVVVAVGLVVFLRRAETFDVERRARRMAVVLAGAGAMALTWSLAAHSAAGAQVALAVPVDAVHLVAMAVWVGGLVVLGGVLLPSGDVSAMRSALPRFSRTAMVCVGLLVATGTYQGWREVDTPTALFGTTYGRVLIAKLVLVVALVALGAGARSWVRRHYGFAVVTTSDKRRARRGPADREVTRFRRLVSVEAGIAAVLLGLTAVLVNAEPGRAQRVRTTSATEASQGGGPVSMAVPFDAGGGDQGRGQLALVVAPARIGQNEIHLSVLDTKGRPRDVPEVRSAFSLRDRSVGPIPIPLQYGGTGHYISLAALSMPGRWELALTVRTSAVDETTVRVPIYVG